MPRPFAHSSFRSSLLGLALSILAGCGPSTHVARTPAAASAPAPAASHAAAARAEPSNDDRLVTQAGQEFLDVFVDVHPEDATALGLHQRDGELEDRTIEGHDKATDREEALLAAIERRLAAARLSSAAKTDAALLVGWLKCDIRRRRVQRPLQRKPDVYLEPLGAIFQMTARDYAPAAERARNVLARLDKIPALVEVAKRQLLNPPKVWTEIAIEQASSSRAFLDQQRPFLLAALPSEHDKVEASLRRAIVAYEEYRRWLAKELLPRSNARFSAGRELFEFLLANDYFIDIGADEVLALGKKIFADTGAQMTDIAKRVDPKAKNWWDVTTKLKAKHPSADELLTAYRREVARARGFLVEKDAVSFPPGDELEVIETPSFLRATTTAAYDQPPPFDAKVSKGFFFVTPVDKALPPKKQEELLRENDFADIVDTSVHEAYPGHHLQLSFARRSPSLVRRALGGAIFSEGWALYSEELMSELGYYDDEQRLIQLEWTLVRAARIIIDVGLHVGDMTFEQAVKVLTDEAHLEKPLALSEVRRYTEEPTQPSAYILGRQAILKLRERVRARDGAEFSLKAFHTDLLARGTVPPSLTAKELFEGAR